jgi:hypothetical protein
MLVADPGNCSAQADRGDQTRLRAVAKIAASRAQRTGFLFSLVLRQTSTPCSDEQSSWRNAKPARLEPTRGPRGVHIAPVSAKGERTPYVRRGGPLGHGDVRIRPPAATRVRSAIGDCDGRDRPRTLGRGVEQRALIHPVWDARHQTEKRWRSSRFTPRPLARQQASVQIPRRRPLKAAAAALRVRPAASDLSPSAARPRRLAWECSPTRPLRYSARAPRR